MKNVLFLATLAIAVFGTAVQANPYSYLAKWVNLGQRVVTYTQDRDVIDVKIRDGYFQSLKFKVLRAPIDMDRCVVHFENGETKEVELRNNIPAGGESRRIDLPGNKRFIEKVVFWYDTKNRSNKRAVVSLWGER